MTGPETILGIKVATIIAAFIGSLVSVVVDFRGHDFLTAIAAVVAGLFVAVIASEPTIEFFDLSTTWGHAIAGIYGITGRNLVIFIRRASMNPTSFLSSLLRGGKK